MMSVVEGGTGTSTPPSFSEAPTCTTRGVPLNGVAAKVNAKAAWLFRSMQQRTQAIYIVVLKTIS